MPGKSGPASSSRGEAIDTPALCLIHFSFLFMVVTTLLLDRGTDCNILSFEGETPLHVASRNSQVEVATLLLVRGADHNILRIDGRTPLQIAEEKGHAEMVALLLGRGAD